MVSPANQQSTTKFHYETEPSLGRTVLLHWSYFVRKWSASSRSSHFYPPSNLHVSGAPNPVLLVQALQVEVKSYQNEILIDSILVKIQHSAFQNANASHKLVTAGVISTLIDLLNRRAVYASTPNVAGLLTLLTSIGLLAYVIHCPSHSFFADPFNQPRFN